MGGLFGGGAKPPPVPTVLPMADQAALDRAKQQAMAKREASSGRMSTILTGDNGQSSTLG